VPSTVDKKHGIVFGSAKRAGLDNLEAKKIPGPGAYNSSEKSKSGPRYGFGSSNRNKEGSSVSGTVPGPGAYQVNDKVGKEGRKYTLSGRPKSAGKQANIPGPAAYNPKIAEKKSGFTFGAASGKVDDKEKKIVPGPGQYTVDKYSTVKKSSPSWK